MGEKIDSNIKDKSRLVDRHSEISALVGMTQAARDDAATLALGFEAHLLDMAVLALSEQRQQEQTS